MIALGVLILSLGLLVAAVGADPVVPKGCPECVGQASCLHCPLQGTARCPIVRGGAS